MISDWGAIERRQNIKPHLSREGGVWWCVSGRGAADRVVGKGRYKHWAYDAWLAERTRYWQQPMRLVG